MELDKYKEAASTAVGKKELQALSDISLAAGLLSIVASVLLWLTARKDDEAHGERFGIFVGLWVPTFLLLSDRLARKAENMD